VWHCVTGYADGMHPEDQAWDESEEETGRTRAQMRLVPRPEPLLVVDDRRGSWRVHPFLVEAETTDLTLDWDHDAYRWLPAREATGPGCLPWLGEVLTASERAPRP